MQLHVFDCNIEVLTRTSKQRAPRATAKSPSDLWTYVTAFQERHLQTAEPLTSGKDTQTAESISCIWNIRCSISSHLFIWFPSVWFIASCHLGADIILSQESTFRDVRLFQLLSVSLRAMAGNKSMIGTPKQLDNWLHMKLNFIHTVDIYIYTYWILIPFVQLKLYLKLQYLSALQTLTRYNPDGALFPRNQPQKKKKKR